MMRLRPAAARGITRLGWLDSRHTFSFGQYYDPEHMGFGPLRVINEDTVAPGGGFATHAHANMEIITYVLQGALAHRDSLGNGSVIRPHEVQRMSAGSGIEHSEFNESKSDPVHFLQIWIQPNQLNIKPNYAQQAFPAHNQENSLRLVVSPDARDGSIAIQQDALIWINQLQEGDVTMLALAPGRIAWAQVTRGVINLNGLRLGQGDAVAIEQEDALRLHGLEDSEVLLFDLPGID